MKNIVFVLLLCLCGCASSQPANHVDKGTRVAVNVTADEVLTSVGDANAADVRVTATRMEKDIMKILRQRGIESCDEASSETGDAKLMVTISTLEVRMKNKMGPFFTIIYYQNFKINYSVKFVSADGSTVFEYDNDADEDNLDEVTQTIAGRVSGRVAKVCDK